MSQQWLYNFITLLVIIFAFFIMLKLQRPAKRPEKNNEYVMPAVQSKQDMPVMAVQSGAESAVVQDEELLAVITAAIYAFNGSAGFRVVSFRRSCNNWQFAGRQNLMNSRM